MPKIHFADNWELQNHIAWCFTRFADFTDYIDHHQSFCHLINGKYILHNAVAILVMSFQCGKYALHMFHCTESPSWRNHKPPRNNTVYLWMVASSDNHCMSTAGHIPVQLKFLFVIQDAELSV